MVATYNEIEPFAVEWLRNLIAAGHIAFDASATRDLGVAYTDGERFEEFRSTIEPDRHGVTGGFWRECDWIPCTDGKARPVEPGTFPLAHGSPSRVGRLRAYGNAIVAPEAAGFIEDALGAICEVLGID